MVNYKKRVEYLILIRHKSKFQEKLKSQFKINFERKNTKISFFFNSAVADLIILAVVLTGASSKVVTINKFLCKVSLFQSLINIINKYFVYVRIKLEFYISCEEVF